MEEILAALERPPLLRRRDFLKLSIAALVPAFAAACRRGPKAREINFFNWSNYIGKRTLPEFEKRTGIRVNYEMFSDEDEMFAKLRTGVHGYDLMVSDDYQVPKLRALGLITPIPEGAVTGLANLEKRFLDPPFDPGLRFTVPYLWGTTGLGFNKKHVSRPSSWRVLWDEKYRGKMTVLDNVRDGIGCALLALGLPTDTDKPEHLAQAKELLVRQRPLIKHYTSATYVDELVSAEAWISQGWSGDVMLAVRENPDIDYAIPDEGSFLYVSSLVLPAGSEHREEALAFMNYSLLPEVAAEVSNTVGFATPNEKARKFLEPALLKDTRVFPDPKTSARLRFYGTLAPETEELWARTWQEVKVS